MWRAEEDYKPRPLVSSTMVRTALSYLVLHYIVLIGVIFLVVAGLEIAVGGVPIWVGVLIAITIGLIYPRIMVHSGYAPTRWEPS